ncbi:MAG: VIT domain-containing protein [Deltaproteobacteria bacterium]
MVTAASMTPASSTPASGARLFARDGATLPLKASHLDVEAQAGLARTVLVQTFANPNDRPLEVTYLLPLPADGAVSGFAFTVAGKRTVGEVDKKKAARERYDAALAAGQSAALLEQERPNTFTQKVGNIPPHQEVRVEVVVDQKLVWIAEEGQWSWRFPTVVGPRYMGEPGRVKDAARVTVDVADGPLPTTLTLDLVIGDVVLNGRTPASPSHAMTATEEGLRRRVRLDAEAQAALDRDFVVRWPVAKPEAGVVLDAARPAEHQGHAYGLLTIVPPEAPKAAAAMPRDLIFLIDTSGSMSGRPLDQAKRVLAAMIDGLADHDRLEMIEFSNRPSRWKGEPVVATRTGRQAAHKWLAGLRAGGGTEMRTGLLEALTPLRSGAQRQVILVTDGYIGFEGEIIETVIERLPKSCRLHTVGVGSAPNDALLKPAARAGGGVCLALAIDEDPERGAARLVSKTALPLVTNVKVKGDAVERTVPMALPDLYAASPAMISVELSPLGGTLVVEGETANGPFSQRVELAPLALGEGHQAVTALFGREWVEDLEAHRCAGGDIQDVDAQIERVGLDFQIATRKTSWVAVSADVTVDPELERMQSTMPHALPYGMSAEGVGLRRAMPAPLSQTRAGVVTGRMRAPTGFGGAPSDEDGFADFDDLDLEDTPEVNASLPERLMRLSSDVEDVLSRRRGASTPAKAKKREAPGAPRQDAFGPDDTGEIGMPSLEGEGPTSDLQGEVLAEAEEAFDAHGGEELELTSYEDTWERDDDAPDLARAAPPPPRAHRSEPPAGAPQGPSEEDEARAGSALDAPSEAAPTRSRPAAPKPPAPDEPPEAAAGSAVSGRPAAPAEPPEAAAGSASVSGRRAAPDESSDAAAGSEPLSGRPTAPPQSSADVPVQAQPARSMKAEEDKSLAPRKASMKLVFIALALGGLALLVLLLLWLFGGLASS